MVYQLTDRVTLFHAKAHGLHTVALALRQEKGTFQREPVGANDDACLAGTELASPLAPIFILIHQEVNFLCLGRHCIGHYFRNPTASLPCVRQVHISPGQVPRSDFKVIQGDVEQVFLGICRNCKGRK